MDKQVLVEILAKHAKWLRGDPGGEQADLRGTNLDFACLQLWYGSKNVKVDRRLAAQLAAHFCVLDCDDPDYQMARTAILEFARSSHRAIDLGLKDGER